ncbi:MAG: class I SAM-dependent methyltransferase [Herpetosiphonaceae bacterium]|nr:class I SAM-dependent methyltransferase [Herpetosiphonaceae bacterium]
MITADTGELARLIDPWLEHMRWRADFATWRARRIHSEAHQQETLAQTTDIVGELAGLHLLDLGCGMGGFAVAAALQGAQVTALDYNPAYCQITATRARKYHLPIPVAQAAGEALPLPAATFDVMCAWDVIEHVQRPDAVLHEAARVLRPGGTLLMTVINRFAFRDPHYHLPLISYLPRWAAEAVIRLVGRSKRGAAFGDRQALGSMHYYTYHGFAQLATQYGFQVRDLDAERVARGGLSHAKPRRRKLLQLLARWRLVEPLYRLNRAVYQGTYRLALQKSK